MSTYLNPTSSLLSIYKELISMAKTTIVKPPEKYHEQVAVVHAILENDESGIVNTVLDYAIQCATKVHYRVETDNENLNNIYNDWLDNLNTSVRRKKIEIGAQGLAKQYMIEMLKGSSQALMRVRYKDKKTGTKKADSLDMNLPTLMWFVDGKDIYVKNDTDAKVIGTEEYKLKIGSGSTEKDFIDLPSKKKNVDEEIFIQTPFDRWGTLLPRPFLIRRGIWKNMKVLALISDEGESIVRKALSYLLLIFKGSDATFEAQGHYSREKLVEAKEGFGKFLGDMPSTTTPTMVTNYDTKIDHLIPDYTKVIKQDLYDPSTKKILQGLGLIEILEGTGSNSRKESVINPKPFIKLVNFLIQSYCDMLTDVIEVSREKNPNNTKYNSYKIKVKATPVTEFIDVSEKELMRTIFDRGVVDYESLCEMLGLEYDTILARSKIQLEDGVDSTLYPHIVINQEEDISLQEAGRFPKATKPTDKEFNDDRTKAGGKNFLQAARKVSAIYKKQTPLPKSVKKLPKDLQTSWITIWNQKFRKSGSEAEAHRLAWGVINRIKRLRLKKNEK